MIDKSQEDGVAAGDRQVRGLVKTFDHNYIGQTFALYVLSNSLELTCTDICGKHLAGRERLGENDRHRAITSTNVGDDHSRSETKNIRELGALQFCLFPLLRHLLGVWVLTCHGGCRQNKRGANYERESAIHTHIT